MAREHYSQLQALIVVARERSFTRAAAQLAMSQSMLSHTIRDLETRLGVRLLTLRHRLGYRGRRTLDRRGGTAP